MEGLVASGTRVWKMGVDPVAGIILYPVVSRIPLPAKT